MNGRSGAPFSASSNDGSEWSGYSRSQIPPSQLPPYSPSYPHSRGNPITPPVSGSSISGPPGIMQNGMGRRPGEPSPPNSVARSSYGTNVSSSENQRRQAARMEERLSQHYAILKRYLAQSLRDEQKTSKHNRARDKLLRLSVIQFQELSTDVYDELLRRQSASGQQTNGPGQVPAYLLPKENFHPKRNQARQKLATLPSSRFRDLATDVFYELERRFPHFIGRDIPRQGSPAMSMHGPPSRVGTPNGMRSGPLGHPPRNASLGGQSLGGQVMAGLGIPGVGHEDEYGRPTAKTFQSNTIIPNKSTMVEDDDDDGMSDVYGGRRDTTYTARSIGTSERDRKALAEFETQVNELQGKVKEMEQQLHFKEDELSRLEAAHGDKENANGLEREQWENLQADLESKLRDAQNLNNEMQSELDRLHNDKERNEHDLRSQLDAMSFQANGESEWKTRYEGLDRAHQELRLESQRQEKTSNDVRKEAANLLTQMKGLSQRTDENLRREEEQIRRLHTLENEVRDWKDRYAKATTQARYTHADVSSLQPMDKRKLTSGDTFTAPNGSVKDIYVTRFQIAVDELLLSARSGQPKSVISHVKNVVTAVRSISMAMGKSSSDDQSEQVSRLRSKLSATTNNLITASKNFAFSNGLSPVSLLDAAASNLSTAIVELLRIVKMRPSSEEQFEREDDDNSIIADSPADYYGFINSRSSVGGESVQSPVYSPQRGPPPPIGQVCKKSLPNGTSNGIAPLLKVPQGSAGDADHAKAEELKNFLDTRTTALLTSVQSLVSAIRTSAPPPDILDTIVSITSTTSQIINQTYACVPNSSPAHPISERLAEEVEKMEQKGREGEAVENEEDWQIYVKGLPPLAFEIAREVKELGAWVEGEVGGGDFS